MTILIFFAVIVALIVVHELGHFLAAKAVGMRVDEFGLGYPPRAWTIGKWGGTEYTLNWLPFGGFVKIFGENGEAVAGSDAGGSQASNPNSRSLTSSAPQASSAAADSRAFTSKNRLAQAFVLVAGIAMNLLFAYALITAALVSGTPRALAPDEIAGARDVSLAIASVLPGSPAARAGLAAGDSILDAKISSPSMIGEWRATDPKSFSDFVARSEGNPMTLDVLHDGKAETLVASPATGAVISDPSRYALGIEVATIGVVPLGLATALSQGASLTWDSIVLTAQGLAHFFYGVFTLSADWSQVSGPVGIAGAVGGASAQGFGYLLSLMAIISINLALINLIPVPALDGGRLLFVLVEGALRRPLKPSVMQALNSVSFAFLVLLMVVVTAHDIFKIVG